MYKQEDHLLDTIVLQSSKRTPKAVVIWLHGLGAEAQDFVPITDQLKLFNMSDVRFLFPNAPLRAITINQGMVMRGWYDIYDLNLSINEDAIGIEQSASFLRELLISENAKGVPFSKMILAGFSQGGAIALHTALRFNEPLAGVVALSTYLPLADRLCKEAHFNNSKIPIYQAHGLFDPVVPLNLGQQTKDILEDLNYKVIWTTYPMQHTVVPEEIMAVGSFMSEILAL